MYFGGKYAPGTYLSRNESESRMEIAHIGAMPRGWADFRLPIFLQNGVRILFPEIKLEIVSGPPPPKVYIK